jgi:hypothetical protein
MHKINFKYKLTKVSFENEYSGEFVFDFEKPGNLVFNLKFSNTTEALFLQRYFDHYMMSPLKDIMHVVDVNDNPSFENINDLDLSKSIILRTSGDSIESNFLVEINEVSLIYHFSPKRENKHEYYFFLTQAASRIIDDYSPEFDIKGIWRVRQDSKMHHFVDAKYLFTYVFTYKSGKKGNEISAINPFPILKLRIKAVSESDLKLYADTLCSLCSFYAEDNIQYYKSIIEFENKSIYTFRNVNTSQLSKRSFSITTGYREAYDFISSISSIRKKELLTEQQFWANCFERFIYARNLNPEKRFLELFYVLEIVISYSLKKGFLKRKERKNFKIKTEKEKEFNKKCHKLIEELAGMINSKEKVKFLKKNNNIKFKQDILSIDENNIDKIQLLFQKLNITTPYSNLKEIVYLRNKFHHAYDDSLIKIADSVVQKFSKDVNLVILRIMNRKNQLSMFLR